MRQIDQPEHRGQRASDHRGYRTKEAMQALKIGRTFLYEMLADGRIASVHVGSIRLIPAAEIERVLRDGVPRKPRGVRKGKAPSAGRESRP